MTTTVNMAHTTPTVRVNEAAATRDESSERGLELPESWLPTWPTGYLDRLVLGDSLRLMRGLPDASIDLILCDLPYGILERVQWDSVIAMDELWAEYRRLIKPCGVIALTGQGMFSARLMLAAEDLYRYTIIWRKNKPRGVLNAKRQPLRSHEDVLIFYKKQPIYNPQMTTGHKPSNVAYRRKDVANKSLVYGVTKCDTVYEGGKTTRYPTSVWDIPVVNNEDPRKIHPTQKPVALGERIINSYTNPGAVVLDNTCGSGAFLVAAKKRGRHFIGFDQEASYVDWGRAWLADTPLDEDMVATLAMQAMMTPAEKAL